MKLAAFGVSMLILSAFGLLFYCVYQEELQMERLHCVKTQNERTSFYNQPIYNSKGMVIGFSPVYITEYEYKCDDGKRWY